MNISSYLLLNLNSNAIRPSKTNAQWAISLLTITAVSLRAEVALLLVPIAYQLLATGSITFGTLMRTICFSGLLSIGEPHIPGTSVALRPSIKFERSICMALGITVSVDSYFWSRWFTWPELYALHHNFRQERTVEWDVSSPFLIDYCHRTLSPLINPGKQLFSLYAYLTSDFTKLLLSSIPLSFFSIFHTGSSPTSHPRNHIWSSLFPHIVFVTLMSALGHKKWSSFVYVVPVWNVAAAKGAHWL